MTAEKAQHNDQQTKKNGQVAMTTFNGQKKKMKNLNVFKTVLAPNAPWPKQEQKTKQKPKPLPKTNENKCKVAIKLRERDVATGRLKGSQRLSG